MNRNLTRNAEQLTQRFYRLSTFEDIADLLEVSVAQLNYHLYWIPNEQRYLVFTLAKKSGGVRTICAPNTSLKLIQHKLVQVLQLIFQPKPSIHGFVPQRSIVTNAEAHMGRKRRFVFNIDLEDFFPSINFGRVRGMFLSHPYEFPNAVATVLAQICCFNNQLPQGAPTSPIISNMLCAKMDSQLQRLAQNNRCFYTRYADDITFSTSIARFPNALAEIQSYPTGLQLEVGKELKRIIVDENGFKINLSKVRLQTSDRRQEITGLVVNKKPNVPRQYIRQIRAMLHAWEKFGLAAAEKEYLTKYRKKQRFPRKPRLLFQSVLRGKIEYLGMVRGKTDSLYLRYLKEYKKLENPTTIEINEPHATGQVFISYSRKDFEFVRKLALALSTLGIQIWLDIENIPFGANWRNTLQEGLDICSTMILVLTPDAMNSENVTNEWQYFLEQKRRILPILFKPTKKHFQISSLNYIDFRDGVVDYDEAFAQLVRSLKRQGLEITQQ